MNKAFVREPDDDGRRRCPRCGSLADAVGAAVLDRYLGAEGRGQLGTSGYFCPFATCDVAYFDDFGRVVLVEQLSRPAYPKDPDAPICACFGLSTDDIERDLAEGVVTRVKENLARARSPEARCGELAADGRSCVTQIQRYYLRRRNS